MILHMFYLSFEMGEPTRSWDKCFRSDGLNLAQTWIDGHGGDDKAKVHKTLNLHTKYSYI